MENGLKPSFDEKESKKTEKDVASLNECNENGCNAHKIGETAFAPDEDVPMHDVTYSPASPDPPNGVKGTKRDVVLGGNHAKLDEDVLVHRSNDPAWEAERNHYKKIVNTFRTYGNHIYKKLGGTRNYLKSLPTEHQRLLTNYRKHLHDIKRCVEENQNLCILMTLEESHLFENQHEVYPTKKMKQAPPEPTNYDYEKVQAIFKQIVRDWSNDGQEERDTCYKPIIEEVEREFQKTKNEDGISPIKILVPGAGLGRLAHELVCRGYVVEGNEFSLFMLFASNFLLNKCFEEEQYKCFPWVHQTTNVLNRDDQIRAVLFPDIRPCDLPPDSKFSMTGGDFLEVYGTMSQKENWDCLATCFFIDCANNIVAYLERIYYCLKLGGIWVNMGPLLYHYADLSEEKSIEPSYDILREIIQSMGFIIEKEETNRPTLKGLPPARVPSSPCKSVTSSPTKSKPTTTTEDNKS
ncbi:carnosine N-methyltransferase isoform X2 [Folsomia candida]|uniref:carnosine N-methyltransferase isoform X2 n=1 Tax=Folsomia candida TaxID=158441 RepID=UPI000B908B54|nr:carnosine N-methyltransferase isoform X2 [Folsomia candida]